MFRLVIVAISLSQAPAVQEKSIAQRIGDRTFPSVFQAWEPASTTDDTNPVDVTARHDLIWQVPGFYNLVWDKEPRGLAEGFTGDSIQAGLAKRSDLLTRNPNMILLVEIRYRDSPKDFLPEAHKWWMRQKNGKYVMGWEEGGFIRLDLKQPDYRKHVAARCKAVMKTGVADGVMLDWWEDDADHLALVQEIRKAIGEKALILVNSNDRITPKTAKYINGYFMECFRSQTPQDWQRISKTLTWAEKNLRTPRINCLETWYHKSREDIDLMKAVTALSLTHSNGYCLFSDPNDLPTPDHMHNWYPFWEKRLGKPLDLAHKRKDGTIERKFTQGIVIYNPPGQRGLVLEFDRPYLNADNGRLQTKHRVNGGSGGIFLIPNVVEKPK